MMVMEKEINKIDGFEVFVKIKMGLPLTEEEMEIYNGYDDDEKKMIFDFINNPALDYDLEKTIKKIETKEENMKYK